MEDVNAAEVNEVNIAGTNTIRNYLIAKRRKIWSRLTVRYHMFGIGLLQQLGDDFVSVVLRRLNASPTGLLSMDGGQVWLLTRGRGSAKSVFSFRPPTGDL